MQGIGSVVDDVNVFALSGNRRRIGAGGDGTDRNGRRRVGNIEDLQGVGSIIGDVGEAAARPVDGDRVRAGGHGTDHDGHRRIGNVEDLQSIRTIIDNVGVGALDDDRARVRAGGHRTQRRRRHRAGHMQLSDRRRRADADVAAIGDRHEGRVARTVQPQQAVEHIDGLRRAVAQTGVDGHGRVRRDGDNDGESRGVGRKEDAVADGGLSQKMRADAGDRNRVVGRGRARQDAGHQPPDRQGGKFVAPPDTDVAAEIAVQPGRQSAGNVQRLPDRYAAGETGVHGLDVLADG